MRPYKKSGVSHFTHRSNRRPVSMKTTGSGIGELAAGTNDKEFNDQMIKRLHEAGQIIAEECRLMADTFSRRIPMSINVKHDSESVYILAGGPMAPNAYPFDPPKPPGRHPLFGNRKHWYDQPYRPFLEEGARVAGKRAEDQFAKIIDDWSKEVGKDRP